MKMTHFKLNKQNPSFSHGCLALKNICVAKKKTIHLKMDEFKFECLFATGRLICVVFSFSLTN